MNLNLNKNTSYISSLPSSSISLIKKDQISKNSISTASTLITFKSNVKRINAKNSGRGNENNNTYNISSGIELNERLDQKNMKECINIKLYEKCFKTETYMNNISQTKTNNNQTSLDDFKIKNININNLVINNNLSKEYTKDELLRAETLFLRDIHNVEMLNVLHQKEQIIKIGLERHKINERMRMRMVDWMIEVINNYKSDENVFFLSVDLMDRYFALSKNILEPSDLHLIGVTSMYTSSKYQDIYPLRLKMVIEKIAHKKLFENDIKKIEFEILSLIDFDIGRPTIWEFILFFIEEMFYLSENEFHIYSEVLKNKFSHLNIIKSRESKLFQSQILNFSNENIRKNIIKTYSLNMINLLRHVSLYLSKMNYHDYNLIINKKPSLLAASTLFVATKICEQINKIEYITECFVKRLSILSNHKENEIIKVSQKILHNAQNFDTMFNGLENLKKIHFNAIVDLKITK